MKINSFLKKRFLMKQYSSIDRDFRKKKELITEKGQVRFNNQKSSLVDAKGRKKSSQKWISRQINDPYANAAKIEGYLARSAYKLIEIQQKYNIFEKKVKTILDLGCAPGSWAQVVLTTKGLEGKSVIGVDLLPVKFNHPDLHFIQGDFEDKEVQGLIIEQIKKISRNHVDVISKPCVDCLICDIALNNIGNAEIDRMRSERIIELALSFAQQYLAKGGNFVCKSIKGADNAVFNDIKKIFRLAYRFKPNSSRKDSSEMFLIGISKK